MHARRLQAGCCVPRFETVRLRWGTLGEAPCARRLAAREHQVCDFVLAKTLFRFVWAPSQFLESLFGSSFAEGLLQKLEEDVGPMCLPATNNGTNSKMIFLQGGQCGG
jgi:hypothetical protein